MNIKEISQQVSEGLLGAFQKYGFKYRKAKNEFVRKSKNVEQVFSLMYRNRHDGSIAIKPELRIHLAEIESLYKKIAEIKYRPYLTLGNYFSNLKDYDGDAINYKSTAAKLWLIEDEKDVEDLIKTIPSYLVEIILPYFDNNSNVKRVDLLLNKYPRKVSVHNEMYPLRANIAIIAAKLNRNPMFDQLIHIYEEEMENAEENYKIEFYKLKELFDSFD